MTRAQKAALTKFLQKRMVTPQYEGIRRDVANALYTGGYVATWFPGDGFRAGYAPLTITEKGREAVQPVTSHDRGKQ